MFSFNTSLASTRRYNAVATSTQLFSFFLLCFLIILFCFVYLRMSHKQNFMHIYLSYLKVDGLGTTTEWKEKLSEFVVNGDNNADAISSVTARFANVTELDISSQFRVISSLPNYHHWLTKASHGIKRYEYFMPHGKSPRNLLLRALSGYDNVPMDTDDVLYNIIEKMFVVASGNHDIPIRKRKKLIVSEKKKSSLQSLLDAVGMSNEEYSNLGSGDSYHTTLYKKFKEQIVVNGFIAWRIHSADLDCVSMNDYDDETGEFKVTIRYKGIIGHFSMLN